MQHSAKDRSTDATLDHREAPGNLRSLALLSTWTCRCVFGSISYYRAFNESVSKIRLYQRKRPTSTSGFAQMITDALLSTSVLDLNVVMPRACDLFWISSRIVPIRAGLPRKDCMPSGKEAMLELG